MLSWEQAAPLIGVLSTAFLGLIGTMWARGRREGELKATTGAVPFAIAGALAERGTADALTNSIGQLTAELILWRKMQESWRDEDDERDRKRSRSYLDEAQELRSVLQTLCRLLASRSPGGS